MTPELPSKALARAKAEIAIEKILRGLEEDTLLRIDQVQVDTRNFANLNVEIFFMESPTPTPNPSED